MTEAAPRVAPTEEREVVDELVGLHSRWLVDRLPVPLLVLPSTVTVDGPARELEGLFEHLIGTLLEPGPPTTGLPTTGKTPRR